VRPFLGVPPVLGSPAPRLESPGIARPLFSFHTEAPAARLVPSLEDWVGPHAGGGESEPGIPPTVVAGLDGGLGQVHGVGEEGGAAHLDQTRDEEGVRGGLPTPLVPQSVSVTPRSDQPVVELSFPEGLAHLSVPPGHTCMMWGRLPTGVPFHYVLNLGSSPMSFWQVILLLRLSNLPIR